MDDNSNEQACDFWHTVYTKSEGEDRVLLFVTQWQRKHVAGETAVSHYPEIHGGGTLRDTYTYRAILNVNLVPFR